VYVTDTGHNAIDEFSPLGEYLGQLTMTEECEQSENPCKGKAITVPFKTLRGMAVDPSGDLWVYGGGHDEYAGTYVNELTDAGEFGRFCRTGESAPSGDTSNGFEVDSDQHVYIEDGADRVVEKLEVVENKIIKEPAAECRYVSELHDNGESLQGADALVIVPPTSGELANDLLADVGGELVPEIGPIQHVAPKIVRYGEFGEPSKEPLETFPGKAVPKSFPGFAESDGLAVNTSATV
jgi:hypothetical protein